MASLGRRKGSAFWQLCYRDPATGKRHRDPTGLRIGDRMQTRQARELCARKTYEEKQAPRTIHRERWPAWVRAFFDQRYADSEKTR
ncbi:MAG TPA: hypothetical protein VJ719_12475, partial [Chthoniobacterales bacterium]|nr:hypothetical protein [Chthoniobacterales bacterium]